MGKGERSTPKTLKWGIVIVICMILLFLFSMTGPLIQERMTSWFQPGIGTVYPEREGDGNPFDK